MRPFSELTSMVTIDKFDCSCYFNEIQFIFSVQSNIHNYSRTFYKIKVDGWFGL